VQQIIVSSATDLGAPADRQGAGLVNTLKAVQLAMSIDGGRGQGANTLLVDQPSLNATVDAGRSHTFTERVTNEGAAPRTVTPTVIGRPTTLTSDAGAVALSSASPTFVDGEGNTDSFSEHQFAVPPGADYLTGDITWNAQSKGTAVFETLFDPQGQVAAYSLLGTDRSGFGHVEVRKPNAGVWTAVIFTVNNAAAYSGAVRFEYDTQRFHDAGAVSPASRTLAPGQAGTFAVTVNAGQAGDEGLRLHVGTGAGDDGSVPIVLRSLVPLSAHGGTFAGTLTGGGSTGNGGQTFTWQFRLPRGEPSLNARFHLADPDYGLTGYLVDPNGQPLDEQVNEGRDLQFFKGSPQAGLWTLTLNVSAPVSGLHLREPFTGTISFAGPPVQATGIPSGKLQAGTPVTARIRITNTGTVTKDFFADPRLDGRVNQTLLGLDQITDVGLPLSLNSQPVWLLPTRADALTMLAQGTVPVTMEAAFFSGDPRVESVSFGNAAVARASAPELPVGLWFGLPEPIGPFGADGLAPGQTVDLAAVAHMNAFDAGVSSTSGDVYLQAAVDPNAPYSPLTLAPGESGTIRLTFTPSGKPGKRVSGFVDVDTFSFDSFSGDEVTTIPYSYKVK
jgi:hypothetical protein